MRTPQFIQRTALWQAVKQHPGIQRLRFLIETSPQPEPLRRPSWRAILNPATAEERAALRGVEDMRDAMRHDQSPMEGLTVSDVCRIASKDSAWGAFLFHLTRATRPSHCLELGTCLGVSAAYIAAALRANGYGQLKTLEGLPNRADFARA